MFGVETIPKLFLLCSVLKILGNDAYKIFLFLLVKQQQKITKKELYFYAYLVSITSSFLGGEMLHRWSGSEIGFAL